MPAVIPPLAFFCIHVLARFPDQLHHVHHRRIPASPALLDAFADAPDPHLWAALAQLVHPLPPDRHDHDLPLSHPALPLLQKIPDSPDFSLVTLVSLPNCTHLRDADVAGLRCLHRLVGLDLRGCSVSSSVLTALAAPASSGLRLLGLHGCPNIDDDVLSPLATFPLLSVVDLRFTRCTPFAVAARLSPLDFRPCNNSTLFHPAPLSLALCSLERVASTASDPVSLYSCPSQSVYRVHVDELDHAPSTNNKIAHVASSSTSHSTIRTISSTEDTIVFIPPLRKRSKSDSLPPPSISGSTSSLVNRPTRLNLDSNVSSFYKNAPAHSRKNVLPLSAQAVQSSEDGKLDPLAITRPPPPWNMLDTFKSRALCNPPLMVACHRTALANAESSRRTQPIARWIGQTLDKPLKVDRARLHKPGSDAVADMVHQFACKRPKIESEFALAKTQARVSGKSRNPFVKNVRSVFAESIDIFAKPRSPVHDSPKESGPEVQLRACRSLPSMTVGQTNASAISNKPLKPITSLKPPILPKESLPTMRQRASKPRTSLKQTRLSFSREGE